MKRTHHTIRTMALAVALTLPAGLSFAAPVGEVVTTRDDQDIHQQFGRDSVYAIQTRQPADTESRSAASGSNGVGEFFAGVGAAGAAAWDRVTGIFEPGGSTAAVAQSEPQMYGRAGGYVGADQIALVERAGPAAVTSQVVTTSESVAAYDSFADSRYPAAREGQLYAPDQIPGSHSTTAEDRLSDASEDAQSAPSPEVGTVEDSQLNAMTAAPADGGEWKQPDQADAMQEQAFHRQ